MVLGGHLRARILIAPDTLKRFHDPLRDAAYLAYRWLAPVFDPLAAARGLREYVRFFRSWRSYAKLPRAEPILLRNTFPQLHDRTETTPFDRHYFFQDVWAARRIFASKTPTHVDVGSNIVFVSFLTSFTDVTFIDLRPLEVTLENFHSKKGTILALPYPDNNVPSLSCLHVVEHIGLGRYGDPLDPRGTENACRELTRVLAVPGNLYLSLPVGKPRLCFNAHRIHDPETILDYCAPLRLVEFSGIDDEGRFLHNTSPRTLKTADYGCGLFHFTRAE